MRCFDGSELRAAAPRSAHLQGSESSGEVRNRSPETSGSESSAFLQGILALCYISPVSHRQFASPRLPLCCCCAVTRASTARASERTYMAVGWVLSRMCNAARLTVPTQPTLPRRALASLARHPPSRAQHAAGTHIRNNRHVRCLLLACALRALRACAARRAQWQSAPPLRAARVRVSADPRAPRRGGANNEAQAVHRDLPPTSPLTTHPGVRACVRGLACAKSPRLARCTPPCLCSSASCDRADRAAARLDEAGRREGRSAATSTADGGGRE